MGQPCPEHLVDLRRSVEPIRKGSDIAFDPLGGRRLEMHPFATDGSGDNLDRPGAVIAPAPTVIRLMRLRPVGNKAACQP